MTSEWEAIGAADEPHACPEMDAFTTDESVPILYNKKFREYGILYSGDESYQIIRYCPWDGTRLPNSLRDEWFDRLDELGLQPEDPAVPEDMRSDRWWRESPGGS